MAEKNLMNWEKTKNILNEDYLKNKQNIIQDKYMHYYYKDNKKSPYDINKGNLLENPFYLKLNENIKRITKDEKYELERTKRQDREIILLKQLCTQLFLYIANYYLQNDNKQLAQFYNSFLTTLDEEKDKELYIIDLASTLNFCYREYLNLFTIGLTAKGYLSQQKYDLNRIKDKLLQELKFKISEALNGKIVTDTINKSSNSKELKNKYNKLLYDILKSKNDNKEDIVNVVVKEMIYEKLINYEPSDIYNILNKIKDTNDILNVKFLDNFTIEDGFKGKQSAGLGAEYIVGALGNQIQLSFGKNKNYSWTAKVVGKETNINNKQQKTDVVITIPDLSITVDNDKNKISTKQNKKKLNINISNKNYKSGNVKLHSGGSITELGAKIDELTKENFASGIFHNDDFQYTLINELHPDRRPRKNFYWSRKGTIVKDKPNENEFIQALDMSISELLYYFGFQDINNENNMINVDFLNINQKFIPVSLLMLRLKDNESNGHLKINTPTLEALDRENTGEGYYSKEFLDSNKSRGINFLNGITYDMELQSKARTVINNKITLVKNIPKGVKGITVQKIFEKMKKIGGK